MPRKTMKEISDDGLIDEAWNAAENRVRRSQIRRERDRLISLGRIRRKTEPTPLVPMKDGHIKCIGGQTYGYDHSSTFSTVAVSLGG
ncbi:MAG: hypothetical protein Tp1125DCM00d2C21254131_25 [Prokaryotic dsDNA virus sp.]|nr:MAG: hypothetical protein Tp1125DCM00d2C21254131_25 [Prokaryotic dsDNA virus sp.]|tara:strand:+ start:26285 stop:26545 length:261 start_codon:yes stop_codon:yes gene_type:complete